MKLKLCPFCANNEYKPSCEEEGGYGYVVVCNHCEARGPISLNDDEAQEDWNKRPLESKKANDSLQQELKVELQQLKNTLENIFRLIS